MKVRANAAGAPLAWGEEVPNGITVTGDIPVDFDATAALGKYVINGTAIEAVPGWTAPEVTLPNP